ncbi:MAG: hypothetical protein PHD95_05240 [Candidatus ainarchaeum sp.]|nr:hypothetical protein [Candidatus ainarchaeum sp.]
MDERVLRFRELFQGLVPNFGLLHAKACVALLSGGIKTAKELSQETLISHNKIYSVLKDLAREKIVFCTNADPVTFYIKDFPKIYEKLVNRKICFLQKLPEELDKMLSNENEALEEKEYLIKVSEKQTRLFDNKNKVLVKEPLEVKQVLKQLNIYIEKLEPKKEYTYAIYH